MKRTKRTTWIALLVLVLSLGSMPVAAEGGGDDAQFGGRFILEAGEQRAGNLSVFGGTTELRRDSVVHGSVIVMGGETTVDGTIDSDLVAFGGTVELGAHAVIGGDLVVFGSVRQHPSATIRGNTVLGLDMAKQFSHLRPAPTPPWAPGSSTPARNERGNKTSGLLRAARGLGTILILLLIAVVIEALLPDHLRRITETARVSWLLSLVMGAFTFAVLIAVVPLLAIICIGIPVSIVFVAAFAASALLGWIAIGKLVGERLLSLKSPTSSAVAATLIGTLVITVLAQIPCLGWPILLVLVCMGVGAVVLTRFGVHTYSPYTGRAAAPTRSGPHGPSSSTTPHTRDLDPFREPYLDTDDPEDRPI